MSRLMSAFGPYRLDPLTRTLSRKSVRVEIAPKAFDTLHYLVTNQGRTVRREEIMRAVWPDTFVEDANLNYNISQIRKLLGEFAPGIPYIQTVPKLGYRFVANVIEKSADDEVETPPNPFWAKWPRRLRWAIVLSGVAVLVVMVWIRTARPRVPAAASNTPQAGLVRLTSDSGLTMTPALSRDGTLIAFASDRGSQGNLRIWLQHVDGSDAISLTNGPADDYSPSFSPDGRTIVFRSEQEGGGIYAVSTLGGEVKKIASFGRRPRFSPDGRWIAYWIGTDADDINQSNFPLPGSAKIFVVPSQGGQPLQVRSDFAAASYPIWMPDSKHLLFLGNRDPAVLVEPSDGLQPESRSVDWWVTPIQRGPAVATGANAALRALGVTSISQAPEDWTEDKPGVLVSAVSGDTRNLWRVPISLGDWKVSSTPSRLTSGTLADVQPSATTGSVAFASLTASLDVWSIPIEANRPKLSVSPERLTADAFDHSYPSVSGSGTRIAYSSRRSGTRDIRVKDLSTSYETVISAAPGSAFGSVLSADGTKIMYRVVERQKSLAYLVSLSQGSRELIADDCSVGGWSSDERQVLCVGTTPARISVVDVVSKRRTSLLDHTTWTLWNPRFSPDDRWVSFNATSPGRSRIFIARVLSDQPIPEREWIAVTDGVWDDKPRWSPDGNTLYFISERDGYRCIWAQKLDDGKHPLGAALPIFHAHQTRRSMLNVGAGNLDMSVAQNKIVFNMSERSGNVWLTKLGR